MNPESSQGGAMFTAYFITFLISFQPAIADVEDINYGDNLSVSDFQRGDPRLCLATVEKTEFEMKRFSSLPGYGWDNLRNEVGGQIFAYNYTNCRTTEDGRYLIPDSIFTIPVKSSRVETFAEFHKSWHTANSITSKSVNIGFSSGFAGVSGSFSSEHSRIKRKQIQDKTSTARVQLRFHRYIAKLHPGSPLHPIFRSRLLSMASDLYEDKMSQDAFYKAQLLVRDYGTHALTKIVAGGCLVKTDFLSQSYAESSNRDTNTITASASANFGATFSMHASYQQHKDKETEQGYSDNTKFSYVTTHGGPIYRPYNMTISEWVNDLDGDMVPVDRSGDPLYAVITAEMFPGLPVHLVKLLEKNIRRAVIQYYEMNTIRGCTKRKHPNFSYSANFHDGTCNMTYIDYAFGGVYQSCTHVNDGVSSTSCNGLAQDNPFTDRKNCPDGFRLILLHAGVKVERLPSKSCSRCGFLKLKKCCHINYNETRRPYRTYWCYNREKRATSGYLFGGIWSKWSTNPVTKTKGCPPRFFPARIFQEHFICVSNDYLAKRHAVPFGGFSTCKYGNPMTRTSNRCPNGFSQHLAAIENGCEIRYCMRTGNLTDTKLHAIKRPPFSSKPDTIHQTDVHTIINSDNSIHGGGMVFSKAVYDRVLEESSAVGPLPSSIFTVITSMIGLLWTQLCA